MRRFQTAAMAALFLALPGSAPAAPRTTAIQPGAQVTTPVGSCTLNFIFEDSSGTKYVGTAGHCGKVGDVARTPSPIRDIGPIVFSENAAAPKVDFALIRIDPARYPEVEPGVRNFGGPVGATTAAQTNPGDVLWVTGYGLGFSATATTRNRAGTLIRDDDDEYVADMVAVNGDSGGPVLHAGTGRALGTVSRYNLPTSTDIGPTMVNILERLRASGYPSISLVTAPFG
jgi:hypothetical protein